MIKSLLHSADFFLIGTCSVVGQVSKLACKHDLTNKPIRLLICKLDILWWLFQGLVSQMVGCFYHCYVASCSCLIFLKFKQIVNIDPFVLFLSNMWQALIVESAF